MRPRHYQRLAQWPTPGRQQDHRKGFLGRKTSAVSFEPDLMSWGYVALLKARPSASLSHGHLMSSLNMSKLFSHFATLRKFHLELWLIWLRTTLRPCPNLGSSWLFSNLALHWSCLLPYIHFETFHSFIQVLHKTCELDSGPRLKGSLWMGGLFVVRTWKCRGLRIKLRWNDQRRAKKDEKGLVQNATQRETRALFLHPPSS